MEQLETVRKFISTDVDSRSGYQIRAIIDANMIMDQSFVTEGENDAREMIISMIEAGTLWEVNNYDAFISSMELSTRQEFLTKYTPEDFARDRVRTYKLRGYNIGFALKPIPGSDDVDIISVHNNSRIHGIGEALVTAAVRNGGNTLDHFDGFLSRFYSGLGFKEYGRLKWDERYAPENWNYELNGRPDVILRRYEK